MIHTSEVIKSLSLQKQLKYSNLPTISKSNRASKVDIPEFVVKHKCYMFYGMYVEKVFKLAYTSGIDVYYEIILIAELLKIEYDLEDMYISDCDYSLVYSIATSFCDSIARVKKYDSLLMDETIVTPFGLIAMPDMVSVRGDEVIVYEIKTSTYFSREKEDLALLQLLSYCSIYQNMGYKVTSAYLLLPLSMHVLRVRFSDLDLDTHYSKLKSTSTKLLTRLDTDIYYGYHVQKKSTVYESLENVISTLTHTTQGVQLFLRNPKSGAGRISLSDKKRVRKLLSTTNIKVFCHSVYIVNLSNPETRFEIELEEMRDCVTMNFSGLVVHCGKNVKLLNQSKRKALRLMRHRLRELAEIATPTCPVILETSSGKGTELCYDYDEFLQMYQRLNDDRIKICVDTCHVFAAGYCPLEFIESILEEEPGSIALVHLNGSKKCKGSRVDNHCELHKGYIDISIITAIIELCKSHNIPMVRE